MKIYYYIILFFIAFPFIRFPIKLRVDFSNKGYKIYIYKILLFSNVSKSVFNKREQKIIEKKTERTLIKRKWAVKKFIEKFMDLKYKLNIKVDLKCDFGVDDAAYTAILYGLLNSISSLFYILTFKYFNVKKYKIDLIPHFNKSTLIIDFICIFNVNLVNIITIIFIALNSFEKIENIDKNENFKEANYGK